MAQTLVLDRIVPGVGRIKKASGTTSKVAFNRIQRNMDELQDVGDLETLGKIRDGSLLLLKLAAPDWAGPVTRTAIDNRARAKPGWVYVALREDVMEAKIGIAANVRRRMIQLQVGCAHPLTLLAQFRGGARKEAALHARFADEHLRGEWFRASPALLKYCGR